MPNNDRTGPYGQGPRTGKKNGLCSKKSRKGDQEGKNLGSGRCKHGGKKFPEGFKIYHLNSEG